MRVGFLCKVLLCVFTVFPLRAQTLGDVLDFCRKDVPGLLWISSPQSSGRILSKDASGLTISNPVITVPNSKSKMSFQFLLQSSIGCSFLLPPLPDKEMQVVVETHGVRLSEAYLCVQRMDKSGNSLGIDTFPLKTEGIGRAEKTIDIDRCAGLSMLVYMRGIPENKPQRLTLKRIRLISGASDMDSLPLFLATNNEIHHPLPFTQMSDTCYSMIPPRWKESKILAFGETLHGAEALNREALEMMKYRVEECGSRLLLVELGLSRMLYVNRYVQGDSSFSIDYIREFLKPAFLSDRWIDFFQWLREYNLTHTDKVTILGCDYTLGTGNACMDLFDYVRALYKSNRLPLLRTLCRHLSRLLEAPVPYAFLDSLKTNQSLLDLLGEKELVVLHRCLMQRAGDRSRNISKDYINRDSFMYENLKMLYDLYQTPVTLSMHYGHVKYDKSDIGYPNPEPMGVKAKAHWGDAYHGVALCVGEGESFLFPESRSGGVPLPGKLSPPVSNSVESLLMSYGDRIVVSTRDLSGFHYIRLLGTTFSTSQFRPIIVSRSVDDVFFIRQTKLISKKPEEYKSYVPRLQKALEWLQGSQSGKRPLPNQNKK